MAKGKTVRTWRRTMIILILLVGVGFGAVIFSLVKLQLIQGPELQKRATDQQLKDTTLSAKRGTIYDCNMKELAKSATVWDVILEPAYITDKNRDVIASGLSEILGINKDEIVKRSQKKTYYEILKSKVEEDVRNKILEFKSKNNITSGIRLEENYKRYYPYGKFAATVLGFTGTDNQGLAGVEAEYDSELTGTPGRLVTAQNAVGTDMNFQYEQEVAAKDGDSLVLTIDEVIQHYVEKYLAEGIANNKVQNRGCAIVMNVKTGAILAMAVKGDFDPNNPFVIDDPQKAAEIEAITDPDKKSEAKQKALQEQWRNKCISDVYFPGSVFKMITASAALEEKLVSEDTPFNCPPYLVIGDRKIKDWKTFGHLTFAEGICQSSNVVFMQVGQRLGAQLLFKYFDAFGFTQKTGIDLPGESRSIYITAENMTPVDLACISFGQSNSITPIQMITAACAVANGGYLVQPHIVEKIIDSNGNIVKTADTTPKRQVISKETSQRMCKILQQDAKTGTAKSGYIAGYRVCGKTGTSEKQGMAKGEYIASYCGFAPAEDPEIAMLVFYDQPHGPNGYYGSPVAGPTFLATMTQVLPYIGVQPQYTEEELAKLDGKAPNVVGKTVDAAKNQVAQEGLQAKVYGDGNTVVSQIPEAGKSIPKKGTVVLFTDKNSAAQTVTVPNLVNLTLSEANQRAAEAGLNISIAGAALTSSSAVSSTQSIAEGTKVAPGTVITVTFSEKNQVA
ncbi:penicillin-binding transpeptidase domain-containing protein [Thermocaproicibacter melissae]|jgi:stage V sporulation protein D (sporulation-specific penicillin-binding protein)|uniref:penicillin-binding transpeptidase domain-containing protein n=1 Tax=Thermocaproicibacter melissae TaxID=2966552 RepID=UPI0024B23DDD|nr:penicillin-binding transpeptidase domain-containing protein [Thermocaproicibacter melissae]WBY64572.1 penicillin-binding transpeptidase domain-containing protein [Thermocaproicibacter melissae]